ncbi:amino acid/amide ABC transporter substrate-binding protein, HAAT family [Rhizobiales bacterium GAS188]|nr:amino acid/amide ABC transporter substrate-binding protein, HAAT family [Rhizobiales bacterium GAS188]
MRLTSPIASAFQILVPSLLLILSLFLAASPAMAAPACGDMTGKPASGEPITIGAIVGRTGPDDFSASAKAAKAYFDCVNANGGIKGRPIRYIIADDQWNPETAAQLAAKIVNDEKAVAMVGSASFVECAANAKLYEQAGIVALAGVGVPRECFTARNYAPTNAGPRISTLGAAEYAAETLGAKSFVCIGPNIPNVGTWSCDGVALWAKAKGLTSQTILIDPGSADATSVILQAASSKPDAIVLALPKGLMIPHLVAAEEQGLIDKIKFVSAASGYDLSVPGTLGSAWSGKFYVNMEFNALTSAGEDNGNWRAVMDAYAKPEDPRDTFAQAGYLAARIATATLLGLDPAKIDRKSVTAALSAISGYKSDIFCAPWFYGAELARHNANTTTRMAVTDGKEWKVVSQCRTSSDPELADIRAYEKAHGINQ